MNALNAESTRVSFKEQFYLPDLTPQQSRYFERISYFSGSEPGFIVGPACPPHLYMLFWKTEAMIMVFSRSNSFEIHYHVPLADSKTQKEITRQLPENHRKDCFV